MSQTKAQLLDGKASSIQFSTGSASSPTISFTGDTNTGIYFPGADQVAISTNGTGRLFVSSAGNVGIGTSTAPSANGLGLAIYDASFPRLTFRNSTTGDGTGDGTQLVQDGLNFNFANTESGSIKFFTANTERAVIDSSGRLGLGTSSPAERLEVANGSIAGSVITGRTYTLSNVSSSNPTTVNGSGFTSIPVQVGDIIAFPFSQTRTVTSVVSDTQLTVDSAWTVSFAGSNVTGTGGLGFRTNSTSRVAITAGGNVGIGTTSPGYKLAVIGDAAIDGVTYLTSGTQASPGTISINYGADNSDAYIKAGASAGVWSAVQVTGNWNGSSNTGGKVAFHTGGAERARIDSSGRLLVGTSSASGTNTLFESSSTAANSANVALVKRNSGTADQAGQQLHFYNFGPSGTARAAGTEVGNIRFYGSQPTSGAAQEMASIQCATDLIQTGTNTSGRLVFSTTADGASSPTERMRIGQNGYIHASNTGSYYSTGALHEFSSDSATDAALLVGAFNTAKSHGNASACFVLADYDSDYTGSNFLGAWNVTNNLWRCFIRGDGDLENVNNSYGGISDVKLKENIVDANSQWNDLKALQVRNYNFKEGQTHTQIGLIAQEVELVSPGLVSESPDRDEDGNDLGTVTKSVNYSVLYMKAVKALQEAMERIEVLEQRLTDAGIA